MTDPAVRNDDRAQDEAGSTRGMLPFTESLIPRFSGQDKIYTVSSWIQEIDDNGDIFGWNLTQRLLAARRSLTGTAALWLKSEKTYTTWDNLKEAIKKEFPDHIDSKTIHETMSSRLKQDNETCLDYMFTMKALGKRGKIADYVAIKYIVDGIEDSEINKIMLYGVKSYGDLKEKLQIYEEMKSKQIVKRSDFKQAGSFNSRPMRPATTRCYACGDKNHVITECPHKSQGRKCFNCNSFGHISADCKLRKMTGTEHRPAATSQPRRFNHGDSTDSRSYDNTRKKVYLNSTDGSTSYDTDGTERNVTSLPIQPDTKSDNTSDKMTYRDVMITHDNQNVNKNQNRDYTNKPVKSVQIRDKMFSALVDSGSDVNLMSIECYRELQLPKYDDTKNITMTGFGLAKVKSFGTITTRAEIDGNIYDEIVFYLVPKDFMPFKLILGNEFLRKVVTVMKDGCVWMNPNSEWLCDVNCFAVSTDCLDHVSNVKLKEQVTKLVENYTPCQTKDSPIELKLVLKDDIPVAQRPRRVSLKEQEEVEKQIQEWLENDIIRVSFSKYASPIVLVRKKDSSLRVCVDYHITTGVPRANGQVEQVHRVISTKMKRHDEEEIYELLQQEERESYMQEREDIRQKAKEEIHKIQDENRKNYDKNRKDSTKYKEGDMVAIKHIQYGPGPYCVMKVKRHDYMIDKMWRRSTHRRRDLTGLRCQQIT